MNIVLFESEEIDIPLSRDDARAAHILDVLRRLEGDTFDAGVIDGPRGKVTIDAIRAETIELSFDLGQPTPEPDPITLIVGLPRPQTARKILHDAASMGVTTIHFVECDKTDPNYASSSLWSSGEWRRHLIAGATQAFDTRIPEITFNHSLVALPPMLPEENIRIALDNYEATERFGDLCSRSIDSTVSTILAIGPERGWGPEDRNILQAYGFTLAHLGQRVLRTETAVTTALAIIKSCMGRI